MTESNQLLFKQQSSNGLVEVWQKESQRRLTIDSIEQTCFDFTQPSRLVSPVYHAFMACLLFIDSPQKVLLAGTGGGALARYFHALDPDIRGDAIEISTIIADVARHFFDFPADQWNLTTGDVQQWSGNGYDLILADIADNELTPSWLVSEKMLLKFRRQLSEDGVLVINILVVDADSLSRNLATIRQVFECRTACLSVPDYKNIIVLAFNRLPPYHSIDVLNNRTGQLTESWQLDFEHQLKQLIKDNPRGSGVL